MQAHDMIDMAFAKKRVDDRKLWLLALEPGKLHYVYVCMCACMHVYVPMSRGMRIRFTSVVVLDQDWGFHLQSHVDLRTYSNMYLFTPVPPSI
jgi:hypothetical protein